MAITPVPAVDAVPPFPTFADRATGTYNSKAYAWAAHMGGVFVAQIVALAASVYQNATEALSGASVAASAAITATAAAGVAVGAANFKGPWATLSGPLATPAAVKHDGRFWLLLTNLADVTASTPGGANPDWTSLDAGTEITQQVASNTTAVAGVHYILTTPGVTLAAPAVMAKGESFAFTLTAAPNTCFINFNGHPYRKQATGAARAIDVRAASMRLRYEDATQGLI